MTRLIDIIFGAIWIIFWIYWITAAANLRQQLHFRSRSGALIRLAIIALVIIVIKYAPNGWGQAHSELYLQIIGLVLFASGLLLAVWARVYLGNNWGFPTMKRQGTELITSGPYKFIRHPIYTGILLGMLGTAIGVTLYWLVVFAAFAGYFISSAVAEEKYMTVRFPKEYSHYQKQTKMLLPLLF